MVAPVEVGAGRQKGRPNSAAVVLNLLAAAINLTPAKTRPLLALGRPGVLADVRFAPKRASLVSANGGSRFRLRSSSYGGQVANPTPRARETS